MLNLSDTEFSIGKSDKLVSSVIGDYNRSYLFLISKIKAPDVNIKNLKKSILESLQRLNIDYLDLVLIDISNLDNLNKVLPILEELKTGDLILNWGINHNINVDDLQKVINLYDINYIEGIYNISDGLYVNAEKALKVFSNNPFGIDKRGYGDGYVILNDQNVNSLAHELNLTSKQVILLHLQINNITPIIPIEDLKDIYEIVDLENKSFSNVELDALGKL